MKPHSRDTSQLPAALRSRLLRAGRQQRKGTESFSEHVKQFMSHGYAPVLPWRKCHRFKEGSWAPLPCELLSTRLVLPVPGCRVEFG